jgi:hypothetical protein
MALSELRINPNVPIHEPPHIDAAKGENDETQVRIGRVLIAGLATPALAVGTSEAYYIAQDMDAKKCSVVKEKPTGNFGTARHNPKRPPKQRWTRWRTAEGNKSVVLFR